MTLYDRFGGHLRSAQPLWYPPNVETAALRAASPWLLNDQGSALLPGVAAGREQAWAPGMRQPFPLTAADLLVALGSPAGWAAANVLAIYQCDTATPLVDSLGLGPNLVAAGGPLTQRECVGLPGASFNSKVGAETVSAASRFVDAGAAFMNVNGNSIGFLCVVRCNPNTATAFAGRILSKESGGAGAGWNLAWGSGGAQVWWIQRANAWLTLSQVGGGYPGAWVCLAGYIDDVAGNCQLFTSEGDGGVGAFVPGSITSTHNFAISSNLFGGSGTLFQIAYLACFDRALTSAMRATFWRAFAPAALGTPNSYTRANPLVGNISAGRVVCYGADQLPVMYDGGFLADGNPEYTGVMVHEGVTFLGINSANLPGWGVSGGNTVAAVDGASGMLDACRSTQGGAWTGAAGGPYVVSATAPLAGATNVPFYGGFMYRRATVGTTARAALYFTGDAGGAEVFAAAAVAVTPLDYRRNDTTSTPVRAAHTGVAWFIGAAANAENCDFAEPWLVQNRDVTVLAWRRTALVSAATSTPTLSMTNVGNRRYNPAKGTIEITLSNFRGPSGGALTPTFLQYGAAAAAGSLTLDFSAGQLRLRGWNSAAALAFTVLCGPSVIDQDEWRLKIAFDARYPVPGILGQNVAVERLNAGASPTLLGTWAGGWTPQVADVTPLMAGCDAAGANAARCLIALA